MSTEPNRRYSTVIHTRSGRDLAQQVDQLTRTLREAEQLMQANEQLLSDYQPSSSNPQDYSSQHYQPEIEVRRQRHTTSEEIQALKKELSSIKDSFLQKDEAHLQRLIQQLTHQLHQIELERDRALCAESTRHMCSLGGSLYSQQALLRDEITKTNDVLRRYQACFQNLQDQLKTTGEEKKYYENQCRELNEKLMKMKTSFGKGEVHCIVSTQDNESFKCQRCQSEGSEKELQLQKSQALVTKLESALSEAEQKVMSLSREKEELTSRHMGEVERLMVENNSLHSKITKLTRSNQHLEKAVTAAEERELHWREKAAALSTNLDETMRCLANHERAIRTLEESSAVEMERVEQSRLEIVSSLQSEIHQLKMQLLDEKSLVEIVRQQSKQAFIDHQQLGSDLSKSLEDSEKLRQKYLRAKKHFEEKAALLEEEITETHHQEMEELQRQVKDRERSCNSQLHEHEQLLHSLTKETNYLISLLGGQSQMLCGKKSSPPLLLVTKLRWLQKEITLLKQHQHELQKSLEEQKEVNSILQAKLTAFHNELSSGPQSTSSPIHQTH